MNREWVGLPIYAWVVLFALATLANVFQCVAEAKPALVPAAIVSWCLDDVCSIRRIYDPKFGVTCYMNRVEGQPTALSCVVAEPLP